jgi:ATP-dependent helicase/nuclease subunit A
MAEISVECTDADRPYVQGIADMFFIEDDGIVLIDYKTDSFSDEDQLSEDYSFQLRVYEEALSAAFSLPVKEKYIYSFKMGKMIKL